MNAKQARAITTRSVANMEAIWLDIHTKIGLRAAQGYRDVSVFIPMEWKTEITHKLQDMKEPFTVATTDNRHELKIYW